MIDKTPVRRVAIVGAGTIGGGFAAHFLSKGLEVAVTDPAPDGEAKVRAFVARAWEQLRELDLASAPKAPDFAFHKTVQATVANADFVQENAPETEALKIEVLAEIDAHLPPGKVIASSTSALVLARIAVKTKRPERCILAHPIHPPYLLPLMELAGGDRTDPEAVAFARAFYEAVGLKPITLKREVYGHIANRLQYVIWNEAVRLVLQGYCTPEDVDTAVTYGPGMRWAFVGPFLTYALAGGEGGLKRTFEMFAPRDTMSTDRASRIQLTPEQRQQLIDGVEDMLNGRSMRELAALRDERLMELIKLRRAKPPIL